MEDHVIRLNKNGQPVSPPSAPPEKPRRSGEPRLALLIGIAVFLIALGALATHLIERAVAPGISVSHGVTPSAKGGSDTIATIGKHVLLPQDETPTVAQVSDLAPLQGQAFFANAAVGDIVLIYPKAQRAILYDPKLDKVIEMAPLSVSP